MNSGQQQPHLDKADLQSLAAFRAALRRFTRTAEDNALAESITGQQYQLLLAIAGQEGREWMTVAEAAEALLIAPHAAVGLINRCETAGLVGRRPGTADRRQVHIFLTPTGAGRVQSVARRNHDELHSLLAALKAVERGGRSG